MLDIGKIWQTPRDSKFAHTTKDSFLENPDLEDSHSVTVFIGCFRIYLFIETDLRIDSGKCSFWKYSKGSENS